MQRVRILEFLAGSGTDILSNRFLWNEGEASKDTFGSEGISDLPTGEPKNVSQRDIVLEVLCAFAFT